jgi:hypothetical protein
MKTIEDEFSAGRMERWGEEEYWVTAFVCGHEQSGPGKVVAPAPGAPYAGPGRATAATPSPRDLRAADRRQRELDDDNQ